MKKLVWIIGGMASGKSTIRRLLTLVLATDEAEFIQTETVEVTGFGKLGVVGEAMENGVCDGLDRSFGRLKKEGGLSSVEYSIKNYEITILEGSQTSGKWIDPLVEMCKKHQCEFHLILMDISLWENYNRLLNRIKTRGGADVDMTDKRLESVRAKNKQFEGVYLKCEKYDSINCIKLSTVNKTDEEKILECLEKIDIKEI